MDGWRVGGLERGLKQGGTWFAMETVGLGDGGEVIGVKGE